MQTPILVAFDDGYPPNSTSETLWNGPPLFSGIG
jgi:hypothetical protein